MMPNASRAAGCATKRERWRERIPDRPDAVRFAAHSADVRHPMPLLVLGSESYEYL